MARHRAGDVEACGVGIPAPVVVAGAGAAGAEVLDARPPTCDYSDEVLVLGRGKPGRVRESRRVVHAFPLSSGVLPDTLLTARCGEQFLAEDLQWLPGLTGMPCEYCVLYSLPVSH